MSGSLSEPDLTRPVNQPEAGNLVCASPVRPSAPTVSTDQIKKKKNDSSRLNASQSTRFIASKLPSSFCLRLRREPLLQFLFCSGVFFSLSRRTDGRRTAVECCFFGLDQSFIFQPFCVGSVCFILLWSERELIFPHWSCLVRWRHLWPVFSCFVDYIAATICVCMQNVWILFIF